MRLALAVAAMVVIGCGTPPTIGGTGGGSSGGGSGGSGGGDPEVWVEDGGGDPDDGGEADGGLRDAGSEDSGAPDAGLKDAGLSDGGPGDAGVVDAGTKDAGSTPDAGPITDGGSGPNVNRTNPRLIEVKFKPNVPDPDAGLALGNEQAFLDTRSAPIGQLVIYLHGAGTIGANSNCGSAEHGRLLARLGFHVFMPCYVSDYGVGVCGNDIGGCRLEAFDGMDRNAAIAIKRPDSIEERVVRALNRLATTNPEGDWSWFLVNGAPRWSAIIVSGISHGASTAGIVSKVKPLAGAVMLSGPLDTNQAWLALPTQTPVQKIYGFTHTADTQHPGHLAAFQTMGLPGGATTIDGAAAPYAGSHRLRTSAPTTNGHSSTEAGGVSPKDGGTYVFEPVWKTMYRP